MKSSDLVKIKTQSKIKIKEPVGRIIHEVLQMTNIGCVPYADECRIAI